MEKKTKFTKLIRVWGILLIIGVAVTIATIDIFFSLREFNERSEKIRADYITRQKQIIKEEVDRVIDLISYEKSQSEKVTGQQIKSRVAEAYAIAQNIYAENKNIRSKDEIRKMILDALRPIRFENQKGYYFATRLDGIEMLFADRPEMEGKNMLKIQDTQGHYVVKDMINIVRQFSEGLYEYHWTKPGAKGDDYKKISFVKRFEPYNWFIGTGLYVDDIENRIKSELLETIGRIRFGKNRNGYIFVVSYDGTTLMNDTQRNLIGKNIWDLTDPDGIKVIQEERKAVENPMGDYIFYTWNKPATTKPSPKTSFIRGFKEWQWMVGAGVYLDDVEAVIGAMQETLYRQIKLKIISLLLLIGGIVVIFLFLFSKLSRKLTNDINLFISFFNSAVSANKEIDRKSVQFEELDSIAKNANRMLRDKIQAEEEKNKLAEQVRRSQKMEAIGLMAGGVAHDLNNILSGIVGYPEVLLYDLPEDSGQRTALEAIHESGQRAAAVVADLLTVARGVAGTREIHDLNSLVREYHESPECVKLKSLYPQITFTLQFDVEKAPILCSSVHVKKSLMNIVTNAAEAISGDGNICVSTRKQLVTEAAGADLNLEPGDYFVLGVKDNGPGISAKDLEHIFEPFYTKKTMGRSGTGLGLAVAWNTMEDHNGTISVESNDQGTYFQLYFPVCREEQSAADAQKSSEKTVGHGEHILVVDDEEQLRDLAGRMLRRTGYKVDLVASGEEAVKFIRDRPVDLIILDMIMEPGMNGRQTYEEILKLYPGQKAIIASGFSESEDVKAALRLGAATLLKKPYQMEQISRAVHEALGAWEAVRE